MVGGVFCGREVFWYRVCFGKGCVLVRGMFSLGGGGGGRRGGGSVFCGVRVSGKGGGRGKFFG